MEGAELTWAAFSVGKVLTAACIVFVLLSAA